MAFEIAKAGWLFRESSVLRRWKKNWFVLYQDGTLRFFNTPNDHSSEEAVRMQTDCVQIKAGQQLTGVEPPDRMSNHCLLTLVFRSKTWNLCAESPDDKSAWQVALEESRVIVQQRPTSAPAAPPAYSATVYPQQQVAYAYPGQVAYGSQPPGYVVQAPPGQTTIIYADDPYTYRRRHGGGDVAMGMMAGAAMGSMMMWPILWW